jgi:hypothetical protein
MKNFLIAIVFTGLVSCTNNPGTGNREDQMQTKTEGIDNTPGAEGNLGDTTATSNNNVYNTDSASGQGTTYDTSSNNKATRTAK